MIRKYWVNYDESKVKAFMKEHPDYIIAMEYLACIDADGYVIFENMEEYEKYKAETFTSIYSGWITLDFNKEFLKAA